MSLLAKKITKARELKQPLFSTLEITQSCNLKCKHCYNFDRLGPEQSKPQKFMALALAKKSISQLAEMGSLSLNITGGEPLLHPHLQGIVQYAKEKQFHVRIKTNGLLLSDQVAKDLFQKGVREIDISLYATSEAGYLSFCGKEGFTRTIEAIKNAKNNNIKVNVSLILHKENFKDLGSLIGICEDLEVFYNVSDEITDRHDKTEAKKNLGLSQADYKYLLESPYSYFFEHDNSQKSLHCGCAKTVVAINVHGDVLPCIGNPIKCGNLEEENFDTIWNNSTEMNKLRFLKDEDLTECMKCEFIEHCSRSTGSAYLNTGDYTACDPMALEHAKARKSTKAN